MLTALPSAVAAVDSVKSPPALTAIGPTSVAREIVFARLIATAAATLTPPELVAALGVGSAPPAPLPPFEDDVASAKLRWLATVSSTPVPA